MTSIEVQLIRELMPLSGKVGQPPPGAGRDNSDAERDDFDDHHHRDETERRFYSRQKFAAHYADKSRGKRPDA
ncbi:hypothetical protein [Dyella sp. OK004]|uniref:hypothetical protein n=1 Tax=Dyella sp. OK004 TaxID=1855292 RepID=UPI001160447B|nr:hypothetical protein [Dyella sp. OK004]